MYFCYRYNNKYQKQNKINILIGTPHTKIQICSILITVEILTEYLFEYYNNDTKIFVRYPDSHLTGLLFYKNATELPDNISHCQVKESSYVDSYFNGVDRVVAFRLQLVRRFPIAECRRGLPKVAERGRMPANTKMFRPRRWGPLICCRNKVVTIWLLFGRYCVSFWSVCLTCTYYIR